MKVYKNEFIKMLEYRKNINREKLENLDLSEFIDKELTKEKIEEWKFTGLDNIDFIKIQLKEK